MAKMVRPERERLRTFLINQAYRCGIKWDSPEAREMDLDFIIAFVMTRFETPARTKGDPE